MKFTIKDLISGEFIKPLVEYYILEESLFGVYYKPFKEWVWERRN